MPPTSLVSAPVYSPCPVPQAATRSEHAAMVHADAFREPKGLRVLFRVELSMPLPPSVQRPCQKRCSYLRKNSGPAPGMSTPPLPGSALVPGAYLKPTVTTDSWPSQSRSSVETVRLPMK